MNPLTAGPTQDAGSGPLDKIDPWWDNPTMIVTMDGKRRLTLPVALMKASPGDYFQASFDAEEDAVTFRRIAVKGDWLEVLRQCPVSMDDLPPRSRETFRSKL